MKLYFNSLLLLFCFSYFGCTSESKMTRSASELPATELKPYGRYYLNDQEQLVLITSAAHFGIKFTGKECRIFVSLPDSNAHSYLQYELDGEYKKRLKISGNSKDPVVITAPSDGEHTLWIYKATEAHSGPVFIEKIAAENIEAVTKKNAPLIEFIGNSITCGAAADASEVECGAGEYLDQHNAYMAYGPRVARALGVDFVVNCVSGIGIYRNWNSDAPIMPKVYEKVDFQENSTQLWDFENFNPQIISIALGTNDFSKGDGVRERLPFDSAKFVSNYIEFIEQVKSKHPEAQIALLSSPMVGGKNKFILEHALTVIKKEIDLRYPSAEPIALHFFDTMKARGCTGHPSVEDHEILAEDLKPFFVRLLKNKKN